jgi:hypothetical protein
MSGNQETFVTFVTVAVPLQVEIMTNVAVS